MPVKSRRIDVPVSAHTGLLESARGVVLTPTAFFAAIAANESLISPLLYGAILASLVGLFSIIGIYARVRPFAETLHLSSYLALIVPGFYLLGIFFSMAGSVILSFIYWILLRLLGGEGSYGKTLSVLLYAGTPLLLMGPLTAFVDLVNLVSPVIGFLIAMFTPWFWLPIWMWGLWLSCTGCSIAHKISWARAFVAIFVIPLLIVAVIGVILLILFFGVVVAAIFKSAV